MAVSEALFSALAEALSKPSKNYQALQTAFQIPDAGIRGYREGAGLADEIFKRNLQKQTLSQALGNNVPEPVRPYGDINVGTLKELGGLDAIAKLGKSQEPDFFTKFKLQQDAIGQRQKDRQQFIREMVGAKGNKEAVNQAKNAVQGLGYVDDLYTQMDKLSSLEKAGASTPVIEKFYPEINTLKSNIMRTAGFSEGGKNLTENELGIIVNSFLPTTLDNPQSRQIKKKVARDFYAGTIDLFEAAKLLGPAGAKIQAIAEQQRMRSEYGNHLLDREVSGGDDLNSVFSAEGL